METFSQKISKNLIPDLMDNINELYQQVRKDEYFSLDTNQDKAIEELTISLGEYSILEEKAIKYNHYEDTLNLPVTRFESLDNLKDDLSLRLAMWKSLKEWKELISKWREGKFNEINTDEIKTKCDQHSKVVKQCKATLGRNDVLDELRIRIDDFKNTIPVVFALRNKNLKPHHLEEILKIIGKEFVIDDEFTLNKLMEMEVHKKVEEIQEISTQATQEAILENNFEEVELKWKKTEFTVINYKSDEGYKEMFILADMDELFSILDDMLANINNILASRYLKKMKRDVEILHGKIFYAQETIDDWLICQNNWVYLENIFSAADIKKKLSNESLQFEQVDKFFKLQMKKTYKTKLVAKCVFQGLGEQFKKHKESLSSIQKALENYLELKRQAFPRFYFLSNDELLEILAKANDIHAIQKHMKKCFDNIYALYLGEDPKSTSVYGMISAEGERVDFTPKIISTKIEIEGWLKSVQENMIESLHRKMRAGKADYEQPTTERKNWVLNHPAQVIATISQMFWCVTTEEQIMSTDENPKALYHFWKHNVTQLNTLTALVREGLKFIKHRVIVALITQDVHLRDIVETLLNEDVSTLNDFNWQKQLRFYWEDQTEYLIARQINSELRYGYEFMGATTRLVRKIYKEKYIKKNI